MQLREMTQSQIRDFQRRQARIRNPRVQWNRYEDLPTYPRKPRESVWMTLAYELLFIFLCTSIGIIFVLAAER